MILENSVIDYSRMLLFVFGFLVYWKIEPNRIVEIENWKLNHAWFTTWLQSGHVKVVKKQSMTSKQTIFLVLLQ